MYQLASPQQTSVFHEITFSYFIWLCLLHFVLSTIFPTSGFSYCYGVVALLLMIPLQIITFIRFSCKTWKDTLHAIYCHSIISMFFFLSQLFFLFLFILEKFDWQMTAINWDSCLMTWHSKEIFIKLTTSRHNFKTLLKSMNCEKYYLFFSPLFMSFLCVANPLSLPMPLTYISNNNFPSTNRTSVTDDNLYVDICTSKLIKSCD